MLNLWNKWLWNQSVKATSSSSANLFICLFQVVKELLFDMFIRCLNKKKLKFFPGG